MRIATWSALFVGLGGCAKPQVSPGPSAPPAAASAQQVATDAEAPPTVVPAPTSAASVAAPAPIGTPPAWPDVLAAARAVGLRKPTQAAAMAGLGGDRWAAAIRTTDRSGGDAGAAWSTHVLVVDASGGAVRVLDRRTLVTMEEGGLSEPERARVAVFAEDYDGDGARELLVRFGFSRMLCGIGEVSRRELRVYALRSEGTLRPQVALTLDDRNYREGTTGRESFADRTDDGRADLVVATRGFAQDLGDGDTTPPAPSSTVVYAYVPERDAYARADGKGRAREAAAMDFRIWDDCDDPDEGGQSPGSGAL